MSKRTTFTTISPLPPGITRDVVIEFLHNHQEMIDLNPLVKERHCIKPPSHATSEEFYCTWYSLTDRISYLPGGLANGDVTYTCAFHDLPNGIQTHCYAPAGLNIRDKWTLNGSLPGEPLEPVELGTGAPVTGLYIREDVDMRCSILMTSFVKKTLKKSHAALVERLKAKAEIISAAEADARVISHLAPPSSPQASFRSDLSSRSWSSASSSTSLVPRLHGTGQARPRVTSTYQPPRLATPWSLFQDPQKAYASAGHPAAATFKPSGHPHQAQAPYIPHPSPPRTQQHSTPPAYGRHEREGPSTAPQQQHSQPTGCKYLQGRQQDPLVPAPLRLLRQDSASSVGSSSTSATTTSTSAASAATSRTRPNGRNTAAAVRAAPSVRYRASHPDYPQMNPYADEIRPDRVVGGRGEYVSVAMYGVVGGGRAGCMEEATLRGPFVAELEG